jgi:hypothetical protein
VQAGVVSRIVRVQARLTVQPRRPSLRVLLVQNLPLLLLPLLLRLVLALPARCCRCHTTVAVCLLLLAPPPLELPCLLMQRQLASRRLPPLLRQRLPFSGIPRSLCLLLQQLSFRLSSSLGFSAPPSLGRRYRRLGRACPALLLLRRQLLGLPPRLQKLKLEAVCLVGSRLQLRQLLLQGEHLQAQQRLAWVVTNNTCKVQLLLCMLEARYKHTAAH